LNYRHIYHAGNFADVFKHTVLTLVLAHLRQKEKPFFVLDTHAGIGLYDLSSEEAQKTGEFHGGIARLLDDRAVPEVFGPYLEAVRGAQPPGAAGMRLYPGSPLITRSFLRGDDELKLCELHPADKETVLDLFRGDAQARVYGLDGYVALKSFLPPKIRRGLVLIDPPFERRDEFDTLLGHLKEAAARFANGIYMVWYPVKSRAAVERFVKGAAGLAPESWLRAELMIYGEEREDRLNGSGLFFLNPPWRLKETLEGEVLPYLVRKLGVQKARFVVDGGGE